MVLVLSLVFKIPQYCIYPHEIRLNFPCTNNEVEYEALIQGLIPMLQMKVRDLLVTGDLKLVINHIKKRDKIKKEILKLYAKRVWHLIDYFNSLNITFVPQEKITRKIP